jgi:hypothetical protein
VKLGLTVTVAGAVVVIAAIVINDAYSPDAVQTLPPDPPPLTVAATSTSAPARNEWGERVEAGDGPAFDLVRVTRDGHTVIAGHARPGSRVVVYDGKSALGEVVADARGEWVFLPAAPLQPGQHWLGLVVQPEEGEPVLSEDVMVVVVPEPGQDIAGRASGGQDQPLAMRVARSGLGPTTVLQKPGEPAAAHGLSIDAIDHETSGWMTFSGAAPVNAIVNVYVADRLAGQTKADGNGHWMLRHGPDSLSDQPAGELVVRADQLDAHGNVLARVAVPFKVAPLKGADAVVADAPGFKERAGGDKAITSIEIEAGQNLWRIARNVYGTGRAYTIIYEANRAEIDNPDLIYPGQVFALPEL